MSFGIRVKGFGGAGAAMTPLATSAPISGLVAGAPQNIDLSMLASTFIISRIRLFLEAVPAGDINDDVTLLVYPKGSRLKKDVLLKVTFRSTYAKIVTDDWGVAEDTNDVDDADRFLADDLVFFMETGDFSRVTYPNPPQLKVTDYPSGINHVNSGISRVLEVGNITYNDQDAASQLHMTLESGHPIPGDYRIDVDYLVG